jgi:threonine aldolase
MIDLRSDTVTKPSEAMRKAMYSAEVGDDVYKEDPTVNELEKYTANLLGKEAALFVPSGVMGNQICLNIHTNPSDEVICEADAHIFQYESGSPAALSGIQLYPVKGKNGIIDPEDVKPLVRPASAYYMPRSKVLEIENTHNRAGGTVYTIMQIAALKNCRSI